jgi:hypothetical protein
MAMVYLLGKKCLPYIAMFVDQARPVYVQMQRQSIQHLDVHPSGYVVSSHELGSPG